MAYSFAIASSQYLSTAVAPGVSAVPATIFARCLQTSGVATNQRIAGVSWRNSGTNSNFCYLTIAGNTSFVQAVYRANASNTASIADSGVAIADNSWVGVGGVFTTNASRTVYFDNNTPVTNTDNLGTDSNAWNSLQIGARRSSDPVLDGFLGGQAAEVGAWNVALTSAEIDSLAKGFKPTRIRPQSLVFYAPLIRTLQDTRGGLTITNNNSATVADHPRVY